MWFFVSNSNILQPHGLKDSHNLEACRRLISPSWLSKDPHSIIFKIDKLYMCSPFFRHLQQVARRKLYSSRGWWLSQELYFMAFGLIFELCRLYCDWWGLLKDQCSRTAGSRVELVTSSVVSHMIRRFWNKISFSKEAFDVTRPGLFQRPTGLVGRRLRAHGSRSKMLAVIC